MTHSGGAGACSGTALRLGFLLGDRDLRRHEEPDSLGLLLCPRGRARDQDGGEEIVPRTTFSLVKTMARKTSSARAAADTVPATLDPFA